MIVFYHCYGSAHSSVLAANIHLNELPLHHRPALNQIKAVPYFDYLEHSRIGTPLYCGKDECNNRIYALGVGGAGQEAITVLQDMFRVCNVSAHVVFVDTLHLINIWVRIGGFLSKHCKLPRFGSFLCALGLWWRYKRFTNLVKEVKLDSIGKVTNNIE